MVRRAVVGLVLAIGCGGSHAVSPDAGADASDPTAKHLAAFSFEKVNNPSLSADVAGVLAGDRVTVHLPDGTDPTALIATWMTDGESVTVNQVAQTSDRTANNFTRPVIYTVTARDGSTASFTIEVALPVHGFGAVTTVPGMRPQGLVLVDLDGDGLADVAAAELNGRGVALLLDRTESGATTPVLTSVGRLYLVSGQVPNDVTAADLNADGKPDLVAPYEGNYTTVWLNTTPAGATAPTFSEPLMIPVGSVASAGAIGDFNADARPDVAVANTNSNTISVLLDTTTTGAATASFSIDKQFATDATPTSIAVADYNGDGKPDLAVANNNPGTVSVLLNATPVGSTTPMFAAKVDIQASALSRFVAAGDFDGDGRPDLAVAADAESSIAVLINTTPAGATVPTFAAPVMFATASCPTAIAVRDLDLDGRPDLIAADDCPSKISVLFNTTPPGTASPTFAPHVDLAGGNTPVAIELGDINSDARVDVVLASSGDGVDPGGISVLFGQ